MVGQSSWTDQSDGPYPTQSRRSTRPIAVGRASRKLRLIPRNGKMSKVRAHDVRSAGVLIDAE